MLRSITYISNAELIIDKHYVKLVKVIYFPDALDWDSESFLELVESAREKDEEADIIDILSNIKHPDVDMVILYIWNEDPLNHPWMVWGYKNN